MRKKFMKAAFGTVMAAAVVPMTALTAFAADEGHATLTAEGDSTVIPIYADVDKAEDTTTGDVISVDVSWSNTRVKAESGANVYRWDPEQLKYVLEKESDEVTETAAGKADITITNRSNVDIDYTVEVAADSKFTEENASEKTGNIKTVATTIGAEAAEAANSAEYTADIRLGEGVNLTEAQDGYQLGSYVVTIGKKTAAITMQEMFAEGAVTEMQYTDTEGVTHTAVFTCPAWGDGEDEAIIISLDGEEAAGQFEHPEEGCAFSVDGINKYIVGAAILSDNSVSFIKYDTNLVSEVTSIKVNGTEYISQFVVMN